MLNVQSKSWFRPGMDMEKVHRGCLCCPGTTESLKMNTRLYNGFGGWSIKRNGMMFFCDQTGDYNKAPTLLKFEKLARKEPEECWEAELYLPLRGGVYQRHGYNSWVLIESNEGFA